MFEILLISCELSFGELYCLHLNNLNNKECNFGMLWLWVQNEIWASSLDIPVWRSHLHQELILFSNKPPHPSLSFLTICTSCTGIVILLVSLKSGKGLLVTFFSFCPIYLSILGDAWNGVGESDFHSGFSW